MEVCNQNHSSEYTYDAGGNRVESIIDGVTTQYTYDSNDRLLQQGGHIYTYDDNGNTLSDTIDYNTTTNTYDVKNQLLQTTTPSEIISYRYNINGIRVSKTTQNDNIAYIIDSNRPYAQVIQEVNNNTLEVTYTYGHDLLSQNRDNVIVDYHYDGLGSARFLSDESGVFTDSYDYEAFGKLINKEGNTTNHYLYAGEQYDKETQNYYLRARYFSPTTGRFTQQDTYMGNNHDPITLHKYLYANANPSNMIDPSGKTSMMSLTASIAIRGVLSGLTFYDRYQTASTIYNGEFEDLDVQDMVLSFIGGRFANALIDRLRNMQFLQRHYQRIIDRNKRKNPNCNDIFNSFDGTTLVATENGLVPISEIKIGDKVWAYNEANQTKSLQEVTHLIRGENYKELIDIELTSGEIITTTDNHPFWEINTKEWIEADELTNSSILYNINDKNVTIKSLTNYAKNKRVYNLTVGNLHTYYVGLGGVLGHNMPECTPEDIAKQRRKNRYDNFSANWSEGSFSDIKNKYFTNEQGILSNDRVKTKYENENFLLQLDNENNYFRLYDKINKQYLNVLGEVPRNGHLLGRDAKNFLQEQTHIKNID